MSSFWINVTCNDAISVRHKIIYQHLLSRNVFVLIPNVTHFVSELATIYKSTTLYLPQLLNTTPILLKTVIRISLFYTWKSRTSS